MTDIFKEGTGDLLVVQLYHCLAGQFYPQLSCLRIHLEHANITAPVEEFLNGKICPSRQ